MTRRGSFQSYISFMIASETLDALVARCREHGAAMIALFGSTSRQEETASSDIDLLVRFDSPKGLVAFSGLERELSEIAQRPVDLVTESSLSPYLRKRVLSEMKLLYGTR